MEVLIFPGTGAINKVPFVALVMSSATFGLRISATAAVFVVFVHHLSGILQTRFIACTKHLLIKLLRKYLRSSIFDSFSVLDGDHQRNIELLKEMLAYEAGVAGHNNDTAEFGPTFLNTFDQHVSCNDIKDSKDAVLGPFPTELGVLAVLAFAVAAYMQDCDALLEHVA
jgi:hypothetical protein